jgi:hypothetical protein
MHVFPSASARMVLMFAPTSAQGATTEQGPEKPCRCRIHSGIVAVGIAVGITVGSVGAQQVARPAASPAKPAASSPEAQPGSVVVPRRPTVILRPTGKAMTGVPLNHSKVISASGERENCYLQSGDIALVP